MPFASTQTIRITLTASACHRQATLNDLSWAFLALCSVVVVVVVLFLFCFSGAGSVSGGGGGGGGGSEIESSGVQRREAFRNGVSKLNHRSVVLQLAL